MLLFEPLDHKKFKDNSNRSIVLLEAVEQYYNNTMSKQERLDFEFSLEKDPEFRTQLKDIKSLILSIEYQSQKEQLDEFHKDLPEGISEEKEALAHFRI